MICSYKSMTCPFFWPAVLEATGGSGLLEDLLAVERVVLL